jgi:hypothetical protein
MAVVIHLASWLTQLKTIVSSVVKGDVSVSYRELPQQRPRGGADAKTLIK